MTELVIYPEPFPKDSRTCDIILVQIDSNTSSMSKLFLPLSAKCVIICFIITFYFLSAKTSIVTNLNPLKSVSIFIVYF